MVTACWAKYTGVGIGFMVILNPLLLILLVSACGVPPAAANVLRTVATTQLRFGLYRWMIFRGRTHDRLGRQWWRFHLAKVKYTAISQTAFWVLVELAGVNYLLTYAVCTVGLSFFCFSTYDQRVFADISPEAA